MILYIEDPDLKKEDKKYFTLAYLLPRSTRKIFIESIPTVNSISQTGAPKGSRFRLKTEIVQKRENWTNNYQDQQSVEETIEFEVGKQRTFSEGSKVGNVLAAASLGASLGAGVGAVGSPVGAAIGGAVGGVLGAAGGALLPK
jgi:hypothetical protein